jgi:hypothetical protein
MIGGMERLTRAAVAEFGEHVLQDRRPGPDQVHPVVAEVLPDQRLRAKWEGIRPRGVRLLRVLGEFSHAHSVTEFVLCTNRV